MIIYIATNKINGKVYIGKTVKSLVIRKRSHFKRAAHDTTHFHRALKKYGRDNFFWGVP